MYVDNAAMQLVRNPNQFDVIVTGNLFGDISPTRRRCSPDRSECFRRPRSAPRNKGLYEPIHGSAPDIAGQDGESARDDPVGRDDVPLHVRARDIAEGIERAVRAVLAAGLRTADLAQPGEPASARARWAKRSRRRSRR